MRTWTSWPDVLPNVTKGGDPGGLCAYLAGEGHQKEHENQRVIATNMDLVPVGPLSVDGATAIADELRTLQHAYGAADDWSTWHCSLSIAASEGQLSDAQWSSIAGEFLTEMGMLDPTKSDVRYAVVAHGASAEGNSHVHIVASRRREDGTKVNDWGDKRRSQQAARVIAERHGLAAVAGQQPGCQGARQVHRAEAEQRQRHPEQAQAPLAERMRSHLAASSSVAEYVRRCRADDIEMRASYQEGRVSGYSVRSNGVAQPASRVARDLSLPAVKRALGDDGTGAEAEWAEGRKGAPVDRSGPETGEYWTPPEFVRSSVQALNSATAQAATASPGEVAAMSRDVSGTLTAAARKLEPGGKGPLTDAARESGRWSQRRPAQPGRSRGNAAALVMALLARDQAEAAAAALIVTAALELVAALRHANDRVVQQRPVQDAAGLPLPPRIDRPKVTAPLVPLVNTDRWDPMVREVMRANAERAKQVRKMEHRRPPPSMRPRVQRQ